jgi:hypothetical protein
LLAAAPAGAATRWFVLADHGHRARGGHGGAEPELRIVRGCIAGGGLAAGLHGRIHLVDLSRALFDSLALPPPAGAVGRPLGFALAHPDADATISAGRRRGQLGLLAIALGTLVACGICLWLGRRRAGWSHWLGWGSMAWLPIAYAAIWIQSGALTLSNPIIYPPFGRDIALAGAPGLLLLWLTVFKAGATGGRGLRLGIVALVPAVAAALVSLIASGGIAVLTGVQEGPPLVEPVTGHTSVLLALVATASAGIGLVSAIQAATAAAAAHWRNRRRVTPAA